MYSRKNKVSEATIQRGLAESQTLQYGQKLKQNSASFSEDKRLLETDKITELGQE